MARRRRSARRSTPGARAMHSWSSPPARSGLPQPGGEAMETLTQLARELDPGDFRQTVEKLALYKLDDGAPLTPGEIAACAPATIEAELDEVLHIVAEARTGEIGPMMKRLRAQGVQPVALCMAALRHFRTLFAAAADPEGPARGIARLRPPVFGPRRERMQRQAQNWGAARLQRAISLLTDTDLQLRSAGRTAPEMALVERALIRLAMMRRG